MILKIGFSLVLLACLLLAGIFIYGALTSDGIPFVFRCFIVLAFGGLSVVITGIYGVIIKS